MPVVVLFIIYKVSPLIFTVLQETLWIHSNIIWQKSHINDKKLSFKYLESFNGKWNHIKMRNSRLSGRKVI